MNLIPPSPVQIALVPYDAERLRDAGLSAHQLVRVASALQSQVIRDLAPLWGASAVVSPFLALEQVPAGYLPLVIVLDGDLPFGSQGFHFAAAAGPGALVQYGEGWSVSASHELIEMLCDPSGAQTVPGPSLADQKRLAEASDRSELKADDLQGHVEYLMEVCDPCQNSTYEINGVVVSDFVTPLYYGPPGADSGRYSFTGRVTGALALLAKGYLTWRTQAPDSQIWQAFGPADKGPHHAVIPPGDLEVHVISDAPPAFSRHWVDAHPRAIELQKPLAPRHPTTAVGDAAAERYGEALRTEIRLILDHKQLASPRRENFVEVLRKLADPQQDSFREEFSKDPGAHLNNPGQIPPMNPDDLPSPERYQGVLEALEAGQRFGVDFTGDDAIQWLSRLAY